MYPWVYLYIYPADTSMGILMGSTPMGTCTYVSMGIPVGIPEDIPTGIHRVFHKVASAKFVPMVRSSAIGRILSATAICFDAYHAW